jgi:hypothetical protein
MPWLQRLVAGLPPWRPEFAPGSVHVGFVVDKAAVGQVFLRVLRFSHANIIPPLLHTHLSPPHEVCDSSDQAAHCHHLRPKLGASYLTRHLVGTEERSVYFLFNLRCSDSHTSLSSVLQQDMPYFFFGALQYAEEMLTAIVAFNSIR